MNKNNLSNTLYDKIFEFAYPNHPYARSVIGTEKNIKKFTIGDLKNYRREFYSPSNLTFIINGSFDEKDISDKYFTLKIVSSKLIEFLSESSKIDSTFV